jgi:hypothetical protein
LRDAEGFIKHTREEESMSRTLLFFGGGLAWALLLGCGGESGFDGPGVSLELDTVRTALAAPRATGEVEVVFKGGKGSGSGGGARRAFADFNAHEAFAGRPEKGAFFFRVYDEDLSRLHREIEVQVHGVQIVEDPIKGKHAQFHGIVINDTKPCADSDTGAGGCSGDHGGGGGHDDACSGHSESDHTDDGCGGSDSDTDHDGGSCGGDDHTGGSCGGDDHTGGSCGGGSDHGGGGGPGVNGRYCRIGQALFVKVRDGSTPAVPSDRIHWKWYNSAAPEAMPSVDEFPWTHLCKKEILAGNIVVKP